MKGWLQALSQASQASQPSAVEPPPTLCLCSPPQFTGKRPKCPGSPTDQIGNCPPGYFPAVPQGWPACLGGGKGLAFGGSLCCAHCPWQEQDRRLITQLFKAKNGQSAGRELCWVLEEAGM